MHARAVIAVLGLIALAGCIERKETIKVDADGGVRCEVSFETGSHSEMYLGDAVPTIEGGWLVEEWTTIDDDGDEVFHLKAEAGFPPGARLPSNYAAPTDPAPEMSLQFPTALTIEERRDGSYYSFRRVYEARPWAYINAYREQIEHALKDIKDKDWKDQTPEERRTLIDGMIRFEKEKHTAIARAAFRDVVPVGRQDVWLAARKALFEVPVDIQLVLELIGDGQESDDGALEEIGTAFEAGMRDGVTRAMRERDLGGGKVNEFLARYHYHLKFYEITEELADDSFEITVEMPGVIVGHNGGEATATGVTWKFGGDAVRDRDHELMVTSRVAH